MAVLKSINIMKSISILKADKSFSYQFFVCKLLNDGSEVQCQWFIGFDILLPHICICPNLKWSNFRLA
jgi:hypothetical protein